VKPGGFPEAAAATAVCRRRAGVITALLQTSFVLGALTAGIDHSTRGAVPEISRSAVSEQHPTFSKEIAPIIFEHCAVCHHPGQAAPFSLLTYGDVRKHAPQIVTATQRRYMPPWPPEQGYAEFVGARRLSDEDIRTIGRWAEQGAAEGDPSDLPPAPNWPDGWLLGRPDLVVTLPEPYQLSPEGKDVYRNFVLRLPVTAPRFVRGVELRPGNLKAVHHAFIKVDRTPQSRRLDGQEGQPGFSGMNTPAEMPGGQFLTWQPGKLPSLSPPGLAWRLEPGTDLVLQMHLRPTGKPEKVQPSVALYFTDQEPTNTCFKMALTSLAIDIPSGQSDYVVEDSFRLPVEVRALAVLPHAHYLARTMEAWAILPDGRKQWLLYIKDWDFNWQGDYRYADPVRLPKDSMLYMRFVYDNSTNNVRNPNQPPRRVTYGPQSSDEMAELWLQLLPDSTNQLPVLANAYQAKMMRTFMDRDESLLRRDPRDAKAHTELAQILLGLGRNREAAEHLHTACELTPQDDEPHYALGLLLRQENRLAEARVEFEAALRLNPRNYKAHGNLGLIAATEGDLASAEVHLRAALRINPDDDVARGTLNEIHRARAASPKSPQAPSRTQ
jgi:tetratricopeptide (TPR) repeat protein